MRSGEGGLGVLPGGGPAAALGEQRSRQRLREPRGPRIAARRASACAVLVHSTAQSSHLSEDDGAVAAMAPPLGRPRRQSWKGMRRVDVATLPTAPPRGGRVGPAPGRLVRQHYVVHVLV
jgi:hypothetical protein